MNENGNLHNRLGGIASILIGILNIVLVIYIVGATGTQRYDAGAFFEYFAEKPLALSMAWIVFTITAILAYAVIPAVSDLVQDVNRDWARAATLYGIVGFSVLGIWAITLARTAPDLAYNYVNGDAMTRAAIFAHGLPEIDPDGWFTFGGPGTWLIVMNILALRGKKLSRLHGFAGILLGIGHWATVFGALLENEPLNLFASASGALLYPVWYIWLGIRFLRPSSES